MDTQTGIDPDPENDPVIVLHRRLGQLRDRWSDFYRIYYERSTWYARRLDNGKTHTAETHTELGDIITEDHAQNPVPWRGGILP